MRNFPRKLNLNRAAWSFVVSLMLIGVFGACAETNVVVSNCPTSGTSIRTPIDGAGACNPPALISGNTAATTLSAWDSVTRKKITDTTLMCLDGGLTSTGGTCQFKACKTWYHAIAGTSTGNCTAGCDP
jgi:hypothetical protein